MWFLVAKYAIEEKANMSKEDFIEWACRIAKHSQAMSEQWGEFE